MQGASGTRAALQRPDAAKNWSAKHKIFAKKFNFLANFLPFLTKNGKNFVQFAQILKILKKFLQILS